MWYFTWVLGIGFAVMLAILNAMWGENEDERRKSAPTAESDPEPAHGPGAGATRQA